MELLDTTSRKNYGTDNIYIHDLNSENTDLENFTRFILNTGNLMEI